MVMLFWTMVSGKKSSKVNLLAPHPKEGEEGGRALLWTECLGLHKIHMLQCDGIRRCGFVEVIRIRWGHREELPWMGSVPLGLRRELFPLLYSPSYEDRSRRQQSITGKGPHQNPNMLVPWSQTSSLQNCEKLISVFYKSHSLWYFIIAAQAD